MRLGSSAIEKIFCDPEVRGSHEQITPRLLDAWSAVYPDLTSLPRFAEGDSRPLSICIATEDIAGPVRNGGIGTTYFELAKLLAGLGQDVTVLYLKGVEVENELIRHWVAEFAQLKIKLVPVRNYAVLDRFKTEADRWLRNPYNLLRHLLEFPADVVHVSEWRGSAYLCLLAKRQGLAFDKTLFIVKTSSPWLWNRLYSSQPLDQVEDIAKTQAERLSVELADVVVGGSLHLLRWMSSQGYRLPVNRTFVQPNVINIDHLAPMASRPVQVGTRIPIEEFVFFGRLEARKGLVQFCQAVDRLHRDGVKLPGRITFLGKPGARLPARPDQDILDFIKERSSGWPAEVTLETNMQQSEALTFLASGPRLAVMPSMIENSSLAVYEALLCRIPFVASTSGGTPELVADEDRDVVLCDAHPIPLAAKLKQAVELGGYVARPSFSNAGNLEAWRTFHLDLGRGLVEHLQRPALPPSLVGKETIAVCIYHPSRIEDLDQTLASVKAQDQPVSQVLIAVDTLDKAGFADAQRVFEASGLPGGVHEAFDRDAGLAFNELAALAGADSMIFLWSGATLRPMAVRAMARVANRCDADLVTCFFRVTYGPERTANDHLSAVVLGSVTESFFRLDVAPIPLFVRRASFRTLSGFTSDYRVLGAEHEFVASAQMQGLRCETALMELASVPAWDANWLRDRCYDLAQSQFRSVRPQISAAPLALRELLLLSKGLQLRFINRRARVVDQRRPAQTGFLSTAVDRAGQLLGIRATKAKAVARAATGPFRLLGEPKLKQPHHAQSIFPVEPWRCGGDAPQPYACYVLAVRDGTIYGVARHDSAFDAPIEIEAVVGGRVLRSVVANEAVATVLAPAPRFRRHGFAIPIGGLPLLSPSAQQVVLQVSGTDYILARVKVARPGARLRAHGYEGYCEAPRGNLIQGWVWRPSDPKASVDVAVFINGKLLDRVPATLPRGDLVAAGIGTGDYGFSVPIPALLKSGKPMIIEAVVARDGVRLTSGRRRFAG